MASPIDVNACFDAILTASTLNDCNLLNDADFEEFRITMLQVARKYTKVLLEGKIRPDDIE